MFWNDCTKVVIAPVCSSPIAYFPTAPELPLKFHFCFWQARAWACSPLFAPIKLHGRYFILRLLHSLFQVFVTWMSFFSQRSAMVSQSVSFVKRILYPVFPSRLLYNDLCCYRLEMLKMQHLIVLSGEQYISLILNGCSKSTVVRVSLEVIKCVGVSGRNEDVLLVGKSPVTQGGGCSLSWLLREVVVLELKWFFSVCYLSNIGLMEKLKSSVSRNGFVGMKILQPHY